VHADLGRYAAQGRILPDPMSPERMLHHKTQAQCPEKVQLIGAVGKGDQN